MNDSIVYSSRTGNTGLLAKCIQKHLPAEHCIYCGAPSEEALKAERIYIGFWTDKGMCDEITKDFLKKLDTQEVFLFGTAGFGENAAYFEQILQRTKAELPAGVKVIGTYMCQGKMPVSVRERYEKSRSTPGMEEKMDALIRNFDAALSHPDEDDLKKLEQALDAVR